MKWLFIILACAGDSCTDIRSQPIFETRAESGFHRILYYTLGTVTMGFFLAFCVALVGIFGSY